MSGGLAGLAGAGEVAGLNHRLEAGITQDLGYTAILVVSLGLLRPGSPPCARVLVAALLSGGTQLQVQFALPAAMAGVLLWAILYGILNAQNLAERWRGALSRRSEARLIARARRRRPTACRRSGRGRRPERPSA